MYYIIIRECKTSDLPQVGEVVRNAYLSNVTSSFVNALTREITFQSIVTLAAVMFIFMGVHLTYCLLSVPLVLIMLYCAIYFSYWMKAVELMQGRRPLYCLVAEAYLPFFTIEGAKDFRILPEQSLTDDITSLRRKIIGTISMGDFRFVERHAWLFRLAVDVNYRHKGVGHALVDGVKEWARSHRYNSVLLAMSECQDGCRQLFISTGFQMKQMYHKQLLGSFVTLLMYQLECDLTKPDF